MKNVSKSQKEILDFPHAPKNQQDFVHFFALVSRMGEIKEIKTNNHTISN